MFATLSNSWDVLEAFRVRFGSVMGTSWRCLGVLGRVNSLQISFKNPLPRHLKIHPTISYSLPLGPTLWKLPNGERLEFWPERLHTWRCNESVCFCIWHDAKQLFARVPYMRISTKSKNSNNSNTIKTMYVSGKSVKSSQIFKLLCVVYCSITI